jgi:transposase
VSQQELQKEQEHHKKAFEYYYALGEKRSYPATAKKFGVSVSSVKLWGRSFGWKKRLKERDAEVARTMAQRSMKDEVSHRMRNRQLVQLALVQLAKAIASGKVKMGLADLDRLVRLEAFLADEPDSRQEILVSELRGKSRQELRQMMREEIEMVKRLDAQEREIEVWEKEGLVPALGDGSASAKPDESETEPTEPS